MAAENAVAGAGPGLLPTVLDPGAVQQSGYRDCICNGIGICMGDGVGVHVVGVQESAMER